jgi:lactate racemase
VLDLAAAAGVDDVHIIAALGLHRRMHEYELRHVLGDRIVDAFQPRGMLYQHDAEDPDNLAVIGTTDARRDRRDQQARRRERPVVYANVNQVGDGRRLEVGHHRPRQSYRCLSHHHNPETLQNTKSLMVHRTTARSTRASGGWARCCATRPEDLHVETTLNTDTFPSPFDFLSQARVGVVGPRPRHLPRHGEVAEPDAERA